MGEFWRIQALNISIISGLSGARDFYADLQRNDKDFPPGSWQERPPGLPVFKEIVHGYVVKPVDFYPTKKYPVSFLIHGDPQGRTRIQLVAG